MNSKKILFCAISMSLILTENNAIAAPAKIKLGSLSKTSLKTDEDLTVGFSFLTASGRKDSQSVESQIKLYTNSSCSSLSAVSPEIVSSGQGQKIIKIPTAGRYFIRIESSGLSPSLCSREINVLAAQAVASKIGVSVQKNSDTQATVSLRALSSADELVNSDKRLSVTIVDACPSGSKIKQSRIYTVQLKNGLASVKVALSGEKSIGFRVQDQTSSIESSCLGPVLFGQGTAGQSSANYQASSSGSGSNSGGSSGGATPVEPQVNPPVISSHPQSGSVTLGESVSLSGSATGTSVSYRWYRVVNGQNELISGQTSNSLSLSNLQETGVYVLNAYNSAGSVFSNQATVTVNQPLEEVSFILPAVRARQNRIASDLAQPLYNTGYNSSSPYYQRRLSVNGGFASSFYLDYELDQRGIMGSGLVINDNNVVYEDFSTQQSKLFIEGNCSINGRVVTISPQVLNSGSDWSVSSSLYFSGSYGQAICTDNKFSAVITMNDSSSQGSFPSPSAIKITATMGSATAETPVIQKPRSYSVGPSSFDPLEGASAALSVTGADVDYYGCHSYNYNSSLGGSCGSGGFGGFGGSQNQKFPDLVVAGQNVIDFRVKISSDQGQYSSYDGISNPQCRSNGSIDNIDLVFLKNQNFDSFSSSNSFYTDVLSSELSRSNVRMLNLSKSCPVGTYLFEQQSPFVQECRSSLTNQFVSNPVAIENTLSCGQGNVYISQQIDSSKIEESYSPDDATLVLLYAKNVIGESYKGDATQATKRKIPTQNNATNSVVLFIDKNISTSLVLYKSNSSGVTEATRHPVTNKYLIDIDFNSDGTVTNSSSNHQTSNTIISIPNGDEYFISGFKMEKSGVYSKSPRVYHGDSFNGYGTISGEHHLFSVSNNTGSYQKYSGLSYSNFESDTVNNFGFSALSIPTFYNGAAVKKINTFGVSLSSYGCSGSSYCINDIEIEDPFYQSISYASGNFPIVLNMLGNTMESYRSGSISTSPTSNSNIGNKSVKIKYNVNDRCSDVVPNSHLEFGVSSQYNPSTFSYDQVNTANCVCDQGYSADQSGSSCVSQSSGGSGGSASVESLLSQSACGPYNSYVEYSFGGPMTSFCTSSQFQFPGSVASALPPESLGFSQACSNRFMGSYNYLFANAPSMGSGGYLIYESYNNGSFTRYYCSSSQY